MRPAVRVAAAFVGLLASTQASADIVMIAPSADASIYAESGGLSNGAGQGLFAGQTNDGFVRRSLIAFDVAGSVPPGATINGASLHLYATQSNTGPLTTNLHRLLFAFNEGTVLAPGNGGTGAPANPGDSTWTHRVFNTTPWAMPGGDYDGTASATLAVGAAFQSYTWTSPQLAADVQSWLDAPAQNFGWIILAQTTGSGQAKRYASREYPDAMLQPTLEVDFDSSVPTGACCLPDGNCSTVLDPPGASCLGAYQGNGTTCDTTACPQPTGACCIADVDATCLSVTAADCDAQMGMFQGAFVGCASDLCPVVPTPFMDELPIPNVAQPVTGSPGGEASYEVSFVQFPQQLHAQLPDTIVWGFDDGAGPTYPGPTFEASVGEQITVDWVNDLRENGLLRTSHYLPVDLCPHGAEDEAYAVMHLHGAHVQAEFDGHPELRLLPGQNAVYEYPNAQEATMLWYHDHSLGMTRLGVEMGLAGAYIIRDPAQAALNLPANQYEIPMIIQDRSFNVDGSLKYPAQFAEHAVGNTILVNGKVWPYLDVDRGKYRFRMVNGSGSRSYRLQLSDGATFQQIGTDGGLLEGPVSMTQVLIMPGERVDLVMDFGAYPAGTVVDLINDAPTPFPGTMSMDDVPNVMRFNVGSAIGHTAPVPATLGVVNDEPAPMNERSFVLKRDPDACTGGRWVIENVTFGAGNGTDFDDIDVQVGLNDTEVWKFTNASGLSHPMHIHLVEFRVLDRQPFVLIDGVPSPTGPPVPVTGAELGYKDTVRVDPNEIVRVAATYRDYVGTYIYHCHILEHEDNEMMRQFEITTTCGDGEVGMPAEECDDMNFSQNDSCPDGPGLCQLAFCGDGFVWNTDGGDEQCDAMGEGMYCNTDCTNALCGDDKLNVTAGEECDDGNMVPGDGCDQYCLDEAPVGGNGAGAGEPSGGASGWGANGSGAESGVGGAGNIGAENAGGAGGGDGDDPGGKGCNCRSAAGDQSAGSLWLGALGLMALGGRAASRRRRFETHP